MSTSRGAIAGALLLCLAGCACETVEERVQAQLATARAAAASGAHDEAVQALEQAIELDGTQHEAWSLLAREQAPRVVIAGHELDPARPQLLLELGRVEEHLERGRDALATYRRAIEADAESVEARIRLAALLIRGARGELVLEDRDESRDALDMAREAGILGLAALRREVYRDRHAERRAEARALLTEARERLEGEADPRRDAIDAYLRALDELDAESERRRAETEAHLRQVRSSSFLLGLLERQDVGGEALPERGIIGGSSGSGSFMGLGERSGFVGGQGYGEISTRFTRRASEPRDEPEPTP